MSAADMAIRKIVEDRLCNVNAFTLRSTLIGLVAELVIEERNKAVAEFAIEQSKGKL